VGVLGTAHFHYIDGRLSGMAVQRILVLCGMFYLVVLSQHLDVALSVFACGIFVYSALWCYDIFKGKGKR
jgi:hypothetical protein